MHHNLIYRNTDQGILVDNGHDISIENNTIYTPSGDGVRIRNAAYNVTLRNNILWTDSGYDLYVATDSQQGFVSDYNNLFTAGGATLVWWQKPFTDLFDWQVEADYDNHSIGYTAARSDPGQSAVRQSGGRRLPPANRRFDEYRRGRSGQSCQPGAGRQRRRIDLGAYGNTAEAAQSASRYLRIDYPELLHRLARGRGPCHPLAHLRRRHGRPQAGRQRLVDLYQVGVGQVANIAVVSAATGSLRLESAGQRPRAATRGNAIGSRSPR